MKRRGLDRPGIDHLDAVVGFEGGFVLWCGNGILWDLLGLLRGKNGFAISMLQMPTSQPPRFIVKVIASSQGSGVFIASNLVLTCRHVVHPDGASGVDNDIGIGWGPNGNEGVVPATIYRREIQERISGCDLAVLQVRPLPKDIPIPPWREPTTLRNGDTVYPYAFPDGRFVNGERTVARAQDPEIQLDGWVNPGASGGVVQFRGDHPNSYCFAIVTDDRHVAGQATSYGRIAAFLEKLNLTLPMALPPVPAVAVADVVEYQRRLRSSFGEMNLDGFTIGGQVQKISIEKLWVPAVTRPQREQPAETALLSKAVDENRRLLVVAEAGYGKTTFLRRVGYALLRHDDDGETVRFTRSGTPYWVALRELENYIDEKNGWKQEGYPWLFAYLGGTRDAVECRLGSSYFEGELRHSDTMLLLDGYDEVSLGKRGDIKKLIEAAAKGLACRILVSTRPEVRVQSLGSEGPIFDGFPEMPLLPMRREDIRKFVELWCQSVQPDATKAAAEATLLLAAVNRPGIREMADNPLMMTAMAVLTANDQPLPESRAKLFEAIVKWLLEARPLERGFDDTLDHLSFLALRMIEQAEGNPYEVSLLRAAFLVKDNFAAVGPTTDEMAANRYLARASQTGLINIGTSEGNLFFWHRYLQEYLAAKYLMGSTKKRNELMPKFLADKSSPEVFRLVVGLMGSSRDDLSEMLKDLLQPVPQWELPAQAYAMGLLAGPSYVPARDCR